MLIFLSIVINFVHCEVQKEYPRLIWVHWDRNPPEYVKQFVGHNIQLLSNFTITFLNDDIMKGYIDFSDLPKGFKTLSSQHKSDYFRLALLRKYGGIWLDATSLINSAEEFEKLYQETVDTQSDMMVFNSYHKPDRQLENGFIIAPKNSSVIDLWINEYKYAIEYNRLRYVRKLYREGIDFTPLMYTPVTKNTYLTAQRALQKVYQRKMPNNSKILIKDSEDAWFKFLIDCKFKRSCIRKNWQNPEIVAKYWFIKIMGDQRGYFFPDIEKKKFQKTLVRIAAMLGVVAVINKVLKRYPLSQKSIHSF